MKPTRKQILDWLKTEDPDQLEQLWSQADTVRAEHVGDQVHLRGLIEFGNYCMRRCGYCGLRADNTELTRYRMSIDEIMACVRQAVEFNYGTVVLQSGEDFGFAWQWVRDLVKQIKDQTPLAVTLSIGERSLDELAAWRRAGADRYLLRFETSNRDLFNRIHPDCDDGGEGRVELLRQIKAMGYETGSGVMIGIPGQRYADLADDLALFESLDLDMIGVGPWIAHPRTPLGQTPCAQVDAEQVPNTELMTYKMVALTRLMRPKANIPSTTALATLNLATGRECGLQRGANVIMPNLTPTEYRAYYEIYPAKACINETAGQCHLCVQGRIASIGRQLGHGRGDAPNHQQHSA